MQKLLCILAASALFMNVFGLDLFTYVPVTGNVRSYTQTDFTVTTKFGNYFRTPNA